MLLFVKAYLLVSSLSLGGCEGGEVVGELGGFVDGGAVVGDLVDSGGRSLVVVVIAVFVVTWAIEAGDSSTVVVSMATASPFSGDEVTGTRSFESPVTWVDWNPPGPSSPYELSPVVTPV